MFPQGLWLLWVEENYVIQVFVTVFFFLPNRNNVIQRTQNMYGMNNGKKK